VDVVVHAQSIQPTITGNATFCTGSSTILTSSATTGNQWYNDAGAIVEATGQTLTVSEPGTYTVKASSAGGCSAVSAAFTVTRSATFTVSVTGTNPDGCSTPNGTITATASPAGNYQYTLNGTTNNTGVFSGLGAGNHTVFVEKAGCVVQGSYQLTSGTLP
jgi:hypothetical protein